MNVNIALVGQALCESLRLARQAGISDGVFFDALKLNASRSGLVDLKEGKLRAQEWSPQFSLKHMHKDLNLAASEAGQAALPLLTQVRTLYELGMHAGWKEDDFIGLMRLLGWSCCDGRTPARAWARWLHRPVLFTGAPPRSPGPPARRSGCPPRRHRRRRWC